MALSTYAELQAAVAALLNKTNLTDNIPDFIRLCEASVDGREDLAHHRRRICRAVATIDDEYEATPDDLLAVQSFRLSTTPTVQLEYMDQDAMERMIEDVTDWRSRLAGQCGITPAPPHYYTIVGTEFRFFPAPEAGQSYTGALHVYERLHALTDSNTTNWLLQYYPDIYLYGSALHSAPFLRDDERLAVWGELYETACRNASKADPFPTVKSKLRTDLVGLSRRSCL